MTTIAEAFDPPWKLSRPAEAAAAAVFNCPHSGATYPESFLAAARLEPLALRRSEDAHVQQLFAAMPRLGAPLLEALFPRAFLDVNREPWELDPNMFDGPLPNFTNASSLRVAAGLGTIPRVVRENEEIYRRKLHPEEAEMRLNALYFPYHERLDALLGEVRAHFGAVLLLDCHSMPASAAGLGLPGGFGKPDIVLGDRHGQSCAPAITARLEKLFEDQGLVVSRNRPYAGGFITQCHGKPRLGRHAIQIEINRALYMDEESLIPTPGFGKLAECLTRVMDSFLKELPSLLLPQALAAE